MTVANGRATIFLVENSFWRVFILAFTAISISSVDARSSECDWPLRKIGAPVFHQAKSPLAVAVAGVENPETGEIVWQEAVPPYRSVAGAYDAVEKKVVWLWTKEKDIDVVFNPSSRKIDWRETKGNQNAIVGVYNPRLKMVDWKTAELSQLGVAAAYNPSTGVVDPFFIRADDKQISAYYDPSKKEVEYSTPDYGYSSIAGYFDYTKQKADSVSSKITEAPTAVVIPGLDPGLYSAHKVVIRKRFVPRTNP